MEIVLYVKWYEILNVLTRNKRAEYNLFCTAINRLNRKAIFIFEGNCNLVCEDYFSHISSRVIVCDVNATRIGAPPYSNSNSDLRSGIVLLILYVCEVMIIYVVQTEKNTPLSYVINARQIMNIYSRNEKDKEIKKVMMF